MPCFDMENKSLNGIIQEGLKTLHKLESRQSLSLEYPAVMKYLITYLLPNLYT